MAGGMAFAEQKENPQIQQMLKQCDVYFIRNGQRQKIENAQQYEQITGNLQKGDIFEYHDKQSKTAIIAGAPQTIAFYRPADKGGRTQLDDQRDEITRPAPTYGVQWKNACAFQSDISVLYQRHNGVPDSIVYSNAPVQSIPAKRDGRVAYGMQEMLFETGEFVTPGNPEYEQIMNSASNLRVRTFYVENIPPIDLLVGPEEGQRLTDIMIRRLIGLGVPDPYNMFGWVGYPRPPPGSTERPTKYLIDLFQYLDEGGNVLSPWGGPTGAWHAIGWPDSFNLMETQQNIDASWFVGATLTSYVRSEDFSVETEHHGGVQFGWKPSFTLHPPFDPNIPPWPSSEYPSFRGYEREMGHLDDLHAYPPSAGRISKEQYTITIRADASPNPIIVVKTEAGREAKVKIYNILGQQVQTADLDTAGGQQEIRLRNDMPTGMYLATLEVAGAEPKTAKLIIMK